jgi:hypothetical protein
VEKQIEEAQSSGKDWILLENFEHAKDKDVLLRHHSRLEDEFHQGYRLWVITKECKVISDIIIIVIYFSRSDLVFELSESQQ